MSKEQVEEKPFKVYLLNIDCYQFNKKGCLSWI